MAGFQPFSLANVYGAAANIQNARTQNALMQQKEQVNNSLLQQSQAQQRLQGLQRFGALSQSALQAAQSGQSPASVFKQDPNLLKSIAPAEYQDMASHYGPDLSGMTDQDALKIAQHAAQVTSRLFPQQQDSNLPSSVREFQYYEKLPPDQQKAYQQLKGHDTSALVDFNPDVPMDPASEKVARKLAYYQMPPTAYLMRSDKGKRLLARAAAINPKYDSTKYGMIQNARTAFATGFQGRSVKAIDATMSHLSVLGKYAEALGNGDVKAANRLKQSFYAETGKQAPTNFDAVKNIIAGEVTKAIIGAGGTENDREAVQKVFNRANSPEQLQGAIATVKKLMGGQLGAFEREYNYAVGDGNFSSFLSKASKAEMQKMEQDAQNASQAAPQPGAQPSNAQPTSKTVDWNELN